MLDGDDDRPDATSVIGRVLHLIETRHSDNPAMVTLASSIEHHRSMARLMIGDHGAILAGYRRFAEGSRGYSGMPSVEGSLLGPMLREISAQVQLNTIVSVAVEALQALGETIEY